MNARVVLEKNILYDGVLINGSKGTVMEINYKNSKPKEDELPEYVLVDFDDFKGIELFTLPIGNVGVPIIPIENDTVKWEPNTEEPNSKKSSKNKFYIPLRGGYGSTVHKTQSLTLDKVAIFFGKYEAFTGSDYVSLSRVKRLSDIAILDREIQDSRFSFMDKKNSFFDAQYNEQERLEALAEISE